MYVGVQGIGTSKVELEFLTRHGVRHMDTNLDAGDLGLLVRQREIAAAAGVDLEMIHIPIAESITLALDPQRDRDIDTICKWIEHAGEAGLRGLNYNFSVVGYQRTETRYGRGGSGYSSFEFSKYNTRGGVSTGMRSSPGPATSSNVSSPLPKSTTYRWPAICRILPPTSCAGRIAGTFRSSRG